VDEVWVGLLVNVAFAELAAARPNFGLLINYCSEDWVGHTVFVVL